MDNEVKAKENEAVLYPSSELFNKEEFSDFKVKCQDKVFHVLKLSLASASDVFYKMLTTPDFKECEDGELEIKGVDPECVEAFLRYTYNKKPIEGYSTARKVIELADKYQMSDLKEMCETIIITGISYMRLLELLNLADMLELTRLERACYTFGVKATEPKSTRPTWNQKVPIKSDSTLCIAHENDFILFDPPVWYCQKADPENRVRCTLKEGKELDETVVHVMVDLYQIKDDGRLDKYNSVNLGFRLK